MAVEVVGGVSGGVTLGFRAARFAAVVVRWLVFVLALLRFARHAQIDDFRAHGKMPGCF